ncbi:MAG: hypothetical protein EOS81_10695 [Mesorhizobium sp.]|uniref:hypothetical protein n=1 Tax=unclassified Mesorhizobium TaxID=325217 RepID=UPI000F75967F|nr:MULTISPECIES: hypothetical protein [unclassified Mesorhizobium]RVC65871.1 hypothetical protein EN766_33900 [Mesorhizobium sp. M2A.F.Ca.ET.046.02.1.1]RVC66832.1 hypothetical protein EN759_17500 [Mesorhizobium sp. M00.F.Ca.ET.038.03.1.1]AZO38625.1 hypothetical protein EJ072_32355 [Mesorhizobium sp. M2A.F.Ca.ET.046.03.2.1]RWB37631.1 MAG: hypothetical protein EOQ44_32895 [Mesorhizobium sp.]RWE17926.1 MAG: hypothetical protein EOS76_17780 [Mesorhizobium sp.]
MTISASFKRFWPADRLARLRALQSAATKAGYRFHARNGGDRRVFLSHIIFRKGEAFNSFWNIEEAERWLKEDTP